MSAVRRAPKVSLWVAVLGSLAITGCPGWVDTCRSTEECLPYVRPTIVSVCVKGDLEGSTRDCVPRVVECTADPDCPEPYLCVNGWCDLGEGCESDAACGTGYACAGSVDRCIRR